MVAAIAWAAHHTGLTIPKMEGYMVASVTLELQGEAHGAVGPLRGALTHASGWGLKPNARLAERHRRRGSLPLPHAHLA
jgi:hypothetical protein